MSYSENPILLKLVNNTVIELTGLLRLFKSLRKFKKANQLVVMVPSHIEGLESICGIPVIYIEDLDGIYLGHKIV